MGECRLCHKKGLFVFTNADGLCSKCAKDMQAAVLSDKEIEELDRQAMARSEAFAKVHKSALKGFSAVDSLRKIQPGESGPLSLEEILFLWYLDGTEASGENIAGYWTHDYHIDYGSVTKKFFSYGYLEFADTTIKLANQKVPELKKLLSENGLPVSGKKDILIQRIIENIPAEKTDQAFPRDSFALTPSGKELVAANDHLIYVHRHRAHFGISLETADAIKKAHPKYNCYDIARAALEKDGRKCHRAKDWGLWRNTLYNRSVVRQEENNISAELELLLQVSYLDARGYGNGNTLEPRLAMLAPAIVNRIRAICDGQGITRDELYQQFAVATDKLDIRDKAGEKEAFASLLAEMEPSESVN